MSISGGSSKQDAKSWPVDMTPGAFKNLQAPFAARLAGLLGINPQIAFNGISGMGGGSGITGGTSQPGGTTTAPTRGYTARTGQYFGAIPNNFQVRPDGTVWSKVADSGRHQGEPQTATYMGRADALQPGTGTTNGGGSGVDMDSIFTGDALSGIPNYGGPLTADMTANERTLLNRLMTRANNPGKPGSPAEAELLNIMRGIGGNTYKPEGTLAQFADMLAGASNTGAFGGESPFLQQMIEAAQRPTLEGLTETLTRDLPGRFTAAGQMIQPGSSSAFDRAAAIASRGAANALSDISTEISYNALEAARGRESGALGDELNRRFQGGEGNRTRALTAATSLPGVRAQELDSLLKNLQAQGLPRLIQQMGIDKGIDLYQTRLDGLLKTLGIAAGVTQPTIAQQSESSGSSSQFGFGIK